MAQRPLLERLIYLDPDFISRLYESEFTINPETKITRTQGLQASASIPIFSGGGSSSESRTYSLSTAEMLEKLGKRLERYPDFDKTKHLGMVRQEFAGSKVSSGLVSFSTRGKSMERPASPVRTKTRRSNSLARSATSVWLLNQRALPCRQRKSTSRRVSPRSGT